MCPLLHDHCLNDNFGNEKSSGHHNRVVPILPSSEMIKESLTCTTNSLKIYYGKRWNIIQLEFNEELIEL